MKMMCATCGDVFDETEYQQCLDRHPCYKESYDCPRCFLAQLKDQGVIS